MEWQHDPKIGPNDWGDAGKMQYVIWQIAGPGIQADAQRQSSASIPSTPSTSPDPMGY